MTFYLEETNNIRKWDKARVANNAASPLDHCIFRLHTLIYTSAEWTTIQYIYDLSSINLASFFLCPVIYAPLYFRPTYSAVIEFLWFMGAVFLSL